MLSLDFNKRVKCSWTLSRIKKVFNVIGRQIKINGEVEINLVGEKEIKDLNSRYRRKNKITDVLSFAWQEDKIVKSKYLGQIYICYPQIARQAKGFSVSINEEMARMLAHGFLHLVGYDHAKKQDAEKMFKLQEKIVSEAAGN